MKCPRCDIDLKPGNTREYGLTCNAQICEACQGMWIGAATLEDIELTSQQRFVEFRRIPSADKQLEPLKCPQCDPRVQLEKVENERDTKVIMDVCPQCKNLWLDGGEMKAIQQEGFAALVTSAIRWLRSS